MPAYDLVLRNIRLVSPDSSETPMSALAVRDGVIVGVGPELAEAEATTVLDGRGLLAFPGVVDGHQHWGIYNPLDQDAESESRACAQGGVTTALTYMRTGQYYLNRGGAYADFLPAVLELAQDRSYVDYAFHLAPMTREHIAEIPSLVADHGITSFKIFMFYGGHGLHGASASQNAFLMIGEDESYDIAHFEFVMRGIQAARELHPSLADDVSLSMHCETAEIMKAYTEKVAREGTLTGLEAYSASRPPHSEGLAVTIASYLAHETGLPTINLLHLTSAKAVEAALLMAKTFPHVDFRREVTIGHLLASYETAQGLGGKVNPPLRSPEDVEALWEHVIAGEIDWVVSDHACCKSEQKFGQPDAGDVWLAKSGFGGTEYLLPGLISAGVPRGLSYGQITALTADAPARRYGLHTKGRLEVGYDADIALVDPESPWTVRAVDSESTQDYTPLEGQTMTAAVKDVFLRGRLVLQDGQVIGTPGGQFLRRPTTRPDVS